MFFFKYIIRQIIRKLIRHLKQHNTHIRNKATYGCYTPEDGLQPLYTILEVYYVIVGYGLSEILYPPPTQKSFWERPLNIWIGHQQKTIPALRSEEQVPALGVPPGVSTGRQHTPPYPLFILVPLFASCGKDFTGLQRILG